MKRNKPLFKQRKPGTHARQRWSHILTGLREASTWTVLVPQSLAGADGRTFDMTGAVPAGEDGNPNNPTVSPNTYRWRLDHDGKTVMVYAIWGGWYPHSHISEIRKQGLPRTGDVWYAFTADRKCTRAHCPLTHYRYSDSDAEIAIHQPGRCPLALPGDGSWKYAGRFTH